MEEKSNDEFQINDSEINKIISDIQLTLQSLNYSQNEIKRILPIIIKKTDDLRKEEEEISFENLLKLALNFLDNDSSKIVG